MGERQWRVGEKVTVEVPEQITQAAFFADREFEIARVDDSGEVQLVDLGDGQLRAAHVKFLERAGD